MFAETIISCFPQRWDFASEQKSGFFNQEYCKRAPHDLPLDVRQATLKYLVKQERDAITSVHQMAEVIINSCANIFSTYHVSNEFQFLDFFERSIETVVCLFTFILVVYYLITRQKIDRERVSLLPSILEGSRRMEQCFGKWCTIQ